jgi:hypothetical protein
MELIADQEWHINDYMEKLCPHKDDTLSAYFTASSRIYIEEKDITDEMLLESYTIMAHIVNPHGDSYLPIFERLHTEIEKRKTKKELLDTAMQLSKSAPVFTALK